MTPETLSEMLGVIGLQINRLMMVILCMRSYACYVMLCLLFDVSVHVVSAPINALILILWEIIYAPNIIWSSEENWRQLRDSWHTLPAAIAAIDGTSRVIYTDHRWSLKNKYSGHRHGHCMHTKVIMDNRNHIGFILSGFLGHQNDI